MKKTYVFSLLILFFLVNNLLAKVLTVSNDSLNFPAQYYNIQYLMDNIASSGDTLLVSGTSNSIVTKSYGNIYIKKALTIIGSGTIIYNKIKNVTRFDNIYVDNSDVTIESCYVVSEINSSSGKNANNLQLFRNRLGFVNLTGNYVKMINNYVSLSVIINNYSNIVISNNIFYGTHQSWWDFWQIKTSDKNSVLISNNIFSYQITGGGNWYQTFINISNAIIQNNLFFNITMGNTNYSVYNNNLTYKTSRDTIPFGTNTGANNLIGKDPKFVGWDANTGLSGVNVWEKDFRLKDDSPGKNAGTDGTDIGIYGGQYPWPTYIDGSINIGEANLPVIRDLNILNTVVGKNGKIKFKIVGEAIK